MESAEGIQIIGWKCTLEILKNEEIIGLGFSHKEREVVFVRKWRTEKHAPGYFTTGLLNAHGNAKALHQWKIKHGIDTLAHELVRAAKRLETAFSNSACKVSPSQLWETIGNHEEPPVKIIGYDKEYIVTAESVLSLIYHEIIEIIRHGKIIERCYCGQWYTSRSKQKANHCLSCDPPSQRKIKDLSEIEKKNRREDILRRVKKCRHKPLEKNEKENTQKESTSKMQKGITRHYDKHQLVVL